MLLSLVLACALVQQSAPPKPDPAVTRADIEATLRALASDEANGRSTWSPDADRAAEFLAKGLERAGIRPGGDEGTFLQRMGRTTVEFTSVPKLTMWDAAGATSELVCGIDFDWDGGVPSKKRLRVRPVTKDDEMLSFTDDEVSLFLDGSTADRKRWLGEKQGAGFGLVLAPGLEMAGTTAETKVPRRKSYAMSASELPPVVLRARGKFLQALRAGNVKAVRLDVDANVDTQSTANVVGTLRGVGTKEKPELANEVVLFSAHYDHLRPSAEPRNAEGDKIFNGADDDASGCAAVMELAEAFGAAPPPARTLVFFFATGEEIGLVGTNHYIEAPLYPLAQMVCNLNFEMIGRPDELAGGPGKLWLTGDERSNLGEEFRKLGLAVVVDPRPDQNFFGRSDNIAFARRGIVAQTLSSYNLHTDYHTVDDEIERIDFDHMQAAISACLEAAKALADGRIEPKWNEGGDPSKPAKK